MSENISVERANFRMMYEQYALKEAESRQLPEYLKNKMHEISSSNLKQIGCD